jgi:hypothetical protein
MSHALDFDQAFNRENPRALINIVPSSVEKCLSAIPRNLFEMDVEALKKQVFKHGKGEQIEMLRTAWWIEYNRAQRTQTKFNLSNVYGGICYGKSFMTDYASNSFSLLYIITPPIDYQVQQHRIMNLSFEQEIRILQMPVMKPVYNRDGDMIGEEVDAKLLSVQQKIADSMRNRVMGMPINRTMQINQNFNGPMQSAPGVSGKPMEQMDEAELREYVAELKGEKGIEGAPSRMKDVGDKS